MPRMFWIGIDPGLLGGLAAIGGSGWVGTVKMPKTMGGVGGVWDWIRHYCAAEHITVKVCMEQVTGYIPREEGTPEAEHKHGGQPGSAMFKFGVSYGSLEMALVACGLKEDETYWKVPPRVWQKSLGVESRRKGEKKEDFKRRLKEMAGTMFGGEVPGRATDVNITLNTCDALLLAKYCQMKDQGAL